MRRQFIHETAASARSHPVASVLTILMLAAMVLAVMLTTGRSVGSEQAVLSSIDSAGSRAIWLRAKASANLTSDVVNRLSSIDGIEWAGAFTAAVDASNALVPDGPRAPLRILYTTDPSHVGMPSTVAIPGGLAWASPAALSQLGLSDGVGGVAIPRGASYGVAGQLSVPDFLSELEPLVVVPISPVGTHDDVGSIVVVAASPELVSPVSKAVLSALAVDDPSSVTVETSSAIAELRATVQGQLTSFSRGLVLVLLGLTGVLVAVLEYGLIMMRRKDFGRRRALGASRGFIVSLVIAQTGLLALVGVAVGMVASIAILLASGDPLPGVAFTAALVILGIAVAFVAAVVPAIVASRRDPLVELRVP